MYYPKSAVYHILQLDKPRIEPSLAEKKGESSAVVVRKGETVIESEKEQKARVHSEQFHKPVAFVKKYDSDYEEFFKEYKY